MQTAHALALSALSSLIERADALAQHGNEAKKGEANNEKEKSEGHGSELVCGKEAEANEHRDQTSRSKEVLVIEVAQYGDGRAEVAQEDSREGGHLGLGFLPAALRLCIALDDKFSQFQGGIGGIGDLPGLPARQPCLRYAGAAIDFALRQVVLLPKAHQKAEGFALLGAHKTTSYAMSLSYAMPDRIIFFCIVRA